MPVATESLIYNYTEAAFLAPPLLRPEPTVSPTMDNFLFIFGALRRSAGMEVNGRAIPTWQGTRLGAQLAEGHGLVFRPSARPHHICT